MPLHHEHLGITRILQGDAHAECPESRADNIWAAIEKRLPLPHFEHPIATAQSTLEHLEDRTE